MVFPWINVFILVGFQLNSTTKIFFNTNTSNGHRVAPFLVREKDFGLLKPTCIGSY